MADPLNRIVDRGRGAFCKTDKQGNALNEPPRSLDPVRTKDNPKAVRRPGKTEQDHVRPEHRARVQAAQKRAERGNQ